MDGLPSPGPESPVNRRLDGWKEIAAYVGRGVRTVQRWEHDHGLPIRRIRVGRGETITAHTAELDAWIAGPGRSMGRERPAEDDRVDAVSVAPEAPPSPSVRPALFAGRRTLVAAAAVVALAVVASGIWKAARPSAPFDWRVKNGRVEIYSADREYLWTVPLPGAIAPQSPTGTPSVRIADIDGDGKVEVLVALPSDAAGRGHLYCYHPDGTLRFAHEVATTARYGSNLYFGPWKLHFLAVTDDANTARRAIWVAFNSFDLFPTVLQKLDADGRVLGEYWSDGVVTGVATQTMANGSRVVLVGAANNEFLGGSVSMLDLEHPSGRSPAVQLKYRCESCRQENPLEFYVLPASDVERSGSGTTVVRFSVAPGRGFTAVVYHSAARLTSERIPPGSTVYTFDASLRPVFGERQPAFKVLHDRLFALHALDHPFDAADEAGVWPVLRASGGGFEQLWRPGAAPRPAGAVGPLPRSERERSN